MINRPNTNRALDSQPSDSVVSDAASDMSSDIASDKPLDLATLIVEAASDRKAADIAVLDVADVSYIADYFIVMTGFSNVQVRAIARAVEQTVKENSGRMPNHVEGITDGNWILLDYGDIIAHVFMPREREYYGLEAFWGHARRVDLAAS